LRPACWAHFAAIGRSRQSESHTQRRP